MALKVRAFNLYQPNNMINREYIASELYRVYCEAVGGKAFNGDTLPDWETFYTDETKAKQANAWLTAADRATQLLASAEEEPDIETFRMNNP